jgi:hypothetical protein
MRILRAVVLIGLLGLAACGDDSGGGSSDVAVPTAGEELLSDPLDDDSYGWGIIDGEFGRTFYEGGEYVWENRQHEVRPHFAPEEQDGLDLRDVVVRAEGRVTAGESSIGIFCREVADPDGDAELVWYEFLARDGFAAIRRTDSELNFDVLAETDDLSVGSGEPVALEAGCVDEGGSARLTLAVNGEPVLDATDEDPLEDGVVGLLAYDLPTAEDLATMRWTEFSILRAASSAG